MEPESLGSDLRYNDIHWLHDAERICVPGGDFPHQ